MKKLIFSILLLACGAAAPAAAEVMTYQGRLKDGTLPANGNYSFSFDFCSDGTGTGAGCQPAGAAQSFGVANGLFKSTFTVPSVNLSSGPWYLRVTVNTSILTPLERLTFVPYSVFASTAGYAYSASTLTALSGPGVFASTNVVVRGALTASDWAVNPSTYASVSGIALLNDLALGVQDARVGVEGRAVSQSGDLSDMAVGGNFEVEVPAGKKGMMLGLRTAATNNGGSAQYTGILVDSLHNTGSITDTYGILISTLTAGTQGKVYALYSEDANARTYFAGTVGIGASAPPYALSVSSGAGEGGKLLVVSTGTTEVFSVKGNGEVYTVGRFIGDGSGLTGVTGATGTDNTKVLKAGDTMTGQLTLAGSTLTVTGDAFSVGGSSLVVAAGKVGIGTLVPWAELQVKGTYGRALLESAAGNTAWLGLGHNSNAYWMLTNNATGGDWLSFNNLSNASQLVLTQGGNLGLGATAPMARLHVKETSAAAPYALIVSTNSDAASYRLAISTSGSVGVRAFPPLAALDVAAEGPGASDYVQIWRNSAGVITASATAAGVFYGDGSGLRNISAPANVLKAGDTMTGQLTLAGSTLTVTGDAFSVGGSTLVVLNGKVGIGTNSPVSRLHAIGDPYVTFGNPSGDIVLALIPTAYGNSIINNNSTGNIVLSVDNMERMRLTSFGNIGIGTSSPGYRLHVSSAAGESGTLMAVSTGATNIFWVAGDGAHAMRYIGDGSGLTGVTGATGTDSTKVLKAGDTMTGQLTLAGSTLTVTGNAFSVGGSTLVVQYGRVGISTATPDAQLAIQYSWPTGGDIMKVWEPGAGRTFGLDSSANMYYGPFRNFNSGSIINFGLNQTQVGANAVMFHLNPQSVAPGGYLLKAGEGAAARLVIDSGGKVGISTGLPQAMLDVNGSVRAARYQINDSTMVAILPGLDSIAYGVYAGTTNAPGGNFNVFVGNYSGAANMTGSGNTANGTYALHFNTTGGENTASGYKALYFNMTGNFNTADGRYALYSNTTGKENSASGSGALYSNKTGERNTAGGSGAMYNSVMGSANTVFGALAGLGVANNSFSSSTVMGYHAGYGLSNGADKNILIGYEAGYQVATGTGNIVIGNSTGTYAPGDNNVLNIGGVLLGSLAEGGIGINSLLPPTPARPMAALDVVSTGTLPSVYAQIWRDAGGIEKASMTATGVLYADGSGLRNLTAADPLKLPLAGGTMTGQLSVITNAVASSTDIITNGLVISTGGAVQTTGVGYGTTAGNPRGKGAVDLQTQRGAVDQVASGYFSSIGGGIYNTASGIYSAVPGGSYNTASGQYSFAAGYGAKSTAQNAFTWQDNGGFFLDNNVANRTVFKNQGGFVVTNSTSVAGMSGTVNRGVYITGGGLVGISTGVPLAALDVVSTGTLPSVYAQIWRDAGGIEKASMTATGVLYADGSGLRNIPTVDPSKLPLSGGTLTGSLEVGAGSTMTVTGNAFSVGGSTLVVTGGRVGIGRTPNLTTMLDIGPLQSSGESEIALNTSLAKSAFIRLRGDPALDIMTGSADVPIRLSPAGSAVVTIKPGAVGIGTMLPASALHVAGGSVTITNIPVSSGYAMKIGDNGIIISTGGALQTTGLGYGSASPSSHGLGAVDLQTSRLAAGQAAIGDFSVIGGGISNTANGYAAVVSGGQQNSAGGNSYATVSGGIANSASATYATVGGGTGNKASGFFSVVSGGQQNSVYSDNSASAGGAFNVVSASNSFSGGGLYNTVAGTSSVVAGGEHNTVYDFYGFIGSGVSNVITSSYSVIAGGMSNMTYGIYSAVGGGFGNTANSGYNTIAGGSGNIVNSQYGAIGGGMNNTASEYGTVGGGYGNQAGNVHAVVAGGWNNIASGMDTFVGGGQANQTTSNYSAIAGGVSNFMSGTDPYAFIGGGFGNNITGNGQYAVIGGGSKNQASMPYSGVLSGSTNTASGQYSVVAGGWWNKAGALGATVGGGISNIADVGLYATVAGGSTNTAVGYGSFVGGGEMNTASMQYAAVGGGTYNYAMGSYATVPGGFNNTARGNYSFAAGAKSSSTANGTFTWSDSQAVLLINSTPDQVRFKAGGGFMVSGSTNAADPGFYVTGSGRVGVGAMSAFTGSRMAITEPVPDLTEPYVLKVGTGTSPEMLTVSTTGVVSMPRQSMARAYAPAAGSYVTGAWSWVTMGASYEDNLMEYDTLNSYFTSKYGGLYMVSAHVTFAASNLGTMRGIGIGLNGAAPTSETQDMRRAVVNPAMPDDLNITRIMRITPGQFVRLFVYQDTGGPLGVMPATMDVVKLN